MPLLFSKMINPYSAYAVWKITETEQQLIALSHVDPPQMQINKRSEWMVSRILIKYLSDMFELSFKGMDNLPSGKPILKGQRAEISITHSFPIAATMINLRKPCGIDLELERSKMQRVQHKFLHESELQYQDQLDMLSKIWSAKEVVFKVHGEKNLSFKDEISIQFENNEKAIGRILKPGLEEEIVLRYEKVFDYWMCFNL